MKKLYSKTSFIIIFALTFLFFLPYLIKGKIPMPADALLGLYHPWRDNSYDGYQSEHFPTKNPLITDSILQTYPWRKQVIDDFKSGKWPLWNPYNFSGQPLLANIQSAPFQIFNIFFFIFPFKIAWAAVIITSPILMSLFMYLFLKSLKLSEIPSIYGAFILPFSGYFITWLSWGNMVTTAMWLPLILLCFNKLFEKPKAIWFLILVFATSQTIFSGFWQTAFYVFLASGLYFIYQISTRGNLRNQIIVVSALLLGILISSVQILPSYEFIKNSARDIDQGYYPGRQDWFLPPKHLLGLVVPDYFGNPATYNYWGVWNYLEFASFVGIVPLTLVILSFTTLTRQTKFLGGILILILLFMLPNPASKFLFGGKLPLVSTMQPSRIVILLDFFLVIFSSIGISNLLSNKSRKKDYVGAFSVLIVLLAILTFTFAFKNNFPLVGGVSASHIALRNMIIPLGTIGAVITILFLRTIIFSNKLLVFALFALTIFELFRFGYKFNSFSKLSLIFPQTKTTDFLINQVKPFRIMTVDRRVFNGSSPSVYNIESVHGYDPLFLKDYAKLVSSWDSSKLTEPGVFNRIVTPTNFQSRVADLLNVKYIISLDEVFDPKLVKVFEEGETKIYQNPNAMPRAYFVNEIVKVESSNQQLEKVLDTNFPIKNSAVSSEVNFANEDNNWQINFQDYQDQLLSLKVTTEKEAPLVVTNPFYPGWQAFIDSQEVIIYKVNFMFQGIMVPSGEHTVEFKYQPRSFYNGLFLSSSGVSITILVSLFLWRKKFQS